MREYLGGHANVTVKINNLYSLIRHAMRAALAATPFFLKIAQLSIQRLSDTVNAANVQYWTRERPATRAVSVSSMQTPTMIIILATRIMHIANVLLFSIVLLVEKKYEHV